MMWYLSMKFHILQRERYKKRNCANAFGIIPFNVDVNDSMEQVKLAGELNIPI